MCVFKINLHKIYGVLSKYYVMQRGIWRGGTIGKIKIYIDLYPSTICFNWGSNFTNLSLCLLSFLIGFLKGPNGIMHLI